MALRCSETLGIGVEYPFAIGLRAAGFLPLAIGDEAVKVECDRLGCATFHDDDSLAGCVNGSSMSAVGAGRKSSADRALTAYAPTARLT